MADTLTPNYRWVQPEVGGDAATWGATLNSDLALIDAQVFKADGLNTHSNPGTSLPASLTFTNGSAPSGQQTRWVLAQDTSSEAGSNSGSNFSLAAYSDTGTLLSTPLSFNRASGGATFGNGIVGVTNGSAASAGQVGEFRAGSISLGSAWTMFTGITINVVAVSLSAGDWDVSGNVYFTATGSPTGVALFGSVSTTSATIGAYGSSPLLPNNSAAVVTGTVRVSLASAGTVYLTAEAIFTGGSIKVYGELSARRMR
jgi:hypothetical protein